jgi:hypothetical protein
MVDCVSSVHHAVEVIRRKSGCQGVACIGLRYGATVVAAATAEDPELLSYRMLWDPDFLAGESLIAGRPSAGTVVVDSTGELTRAVSQSDSSDPIRAFELLTNPGHPWDVRTPNDLVSVPGSLLAAIVKHGESRW